MDPLSQAVLGASLSQSCTRHKTQQFSAFIIGALAGMAADLDIFIRSKTDPLLFLEFHRQFTHSLIFIPFAALLCAIVFRLFLRMRGQKNSQLSFSHIYLFSLLGYATHGLLDACTSYGTQLFWPFSDQRIAWNIVSIIDPLLTLPLLILVILAVYKKNARYAQVGFAYAVIFLSLGIVQHNRASDAVQQLALQRGHHIQRMLVKPTFANRHVWKTIYEYNGRYYIDGVLLLWDTSYLPGTSIAKLDLIRDVPWLDTASQQAKDIERFRWFSDDYLALSTTDPHLVIDVRYSFLPNQTRWLWGIQLDPDSASTAHVQFLMRSRPDKQTVKKFLDMVF